MKKAAVLAGGFSSEKEVSLRSGANVCQALQEAGWDACTLDPARGGFSFESLKTFDVVYPVMHGTFGEDGALQGVLQYYGIPYVGCGPAASAITMDKTLTKALFNALGVPCPGGFDTTGLSPAEAIGRIASFPAFVKPVREGSSVGSLMLHARADAEALLPACLQKYPSCLVEDYIAGREMTTGLAVFEGELIFLPILEVVPKNEYYDYQSKYTAGMSQLICPAPLAEETRASIEATCRSIYNFFGLEGSIRVDFILKTDGAPCYLEVNTSPGMTATSDIPAMLRAAGIPLAAFCSGLCLRAMERGLNR